MAEVSKAGANQNVQKVYSDDKKLYVGMKLREASKSEALMKIFDFADKDRNGEIDKSELYRYNGPLFVENIETSDTRVIGDYKGNVGIFVSKGDFKGKLIKNNEIDYYPGLTIEKVNEKGRQVFTQIDTNHDGTLSKEEVQAVVKVKQKYDNAKKEIDNIIKSFKKRYDISLGIGLFGTCGSALTGCIMTIGEIAGGPVAWAATGLFAAGTVGYYCYIRNQAVKDINQVIDKLAKEIGNNPYAKEHNMIENLRKYAFD